MTRLTNRTLLKLDDFVSECDSEKNWLFSETAVEVVLMLAVLTIEPALALVEARSIFKSSTLRRLVISSLYRTRAETIALTLSQHQVRLAWQRAEEFLQRW
jgi:hypothetical protein